MSHPLETQRQLATRSLLSNEKDTRLGSAVQIITLRIQGFKLPPEYPSPPITKRNSKTNQRQTKNLKE